MKKALTLFSTGLDSLLAAVIIKEQGIDVEGVCFVMQFDNLAAEARAGRVTEAGARIGIPVRVVDISEAFLPVLLAPKHGYGSGVNPCIDCHLFMLRKAAEMMAAGEADFLVTGEVIGQRPMSQRLDTLLHMNKEIDFSNLVVRPLSARLLPPTLPEQEGWVDRDRLYAISGRSRRHQLELAGQYGITEYNSPAGGCILTDPIFSRRLTRLFAIKTKEAVTLDDLSLLRIGRHFQVDGGAHVVTGRNEAENEKLARFYPGGWRFEPAEAAGPLVIADTVDSSGEMEQIAAITARYTKKDHDLDTVTVRWEHEDRQGTLSVRSIDAAQLEAWRL